MVEETTNTDGMTIFGGDEDEKKDNQYETSDKELPAAIKRQIQDLEQQHLALLKEKKLIEPEKPRFTALEGLQNMF